MISFQRLALPPTEILCRKCEMCHFCGLCWAGCVLSICVQRTRIYSTFHTTKMPPRNKKAAGQKWKKLKIRRLMKIHNLLSSILFASCISKRRWIKSSDRFCQLARKTFARTCAARNSHQRAKWSPIQNAVFILAIAGLLQTLKKSLFCQYFSASAED